MAYKTGNFDTEPVERRSDLQMKAKYHHSKLEVELTGG